jgi:nicotinamide-nucleotide amidase
MSKQLSAIGCDIAAHMTVPDGQAEIEQAIRYLAPQCDALIVSGGLGPTEDDLTRQALAAVLGVELELSEEWLQAMLAFFQKLNRPMPEKNRIQAMIPKGAKMLFNTCGTAAGIRATLRKDEGGRMKDESSSLHPSSFSLQPYSTEIFVVPGVPKEMKAMFNNDVLPWVKERSGGAVILQRTLHTFGMGESTVAEKLGPLMDRKRNPSVGTTVSGGLVSLRVNARFPSFEQAEAQMESTTDACKKALGDLIFGQDEDTLPKVLALLLNPHAGVQKARTVTTAESCTGGLVAKLLTDIPGSSEYFKMGFITYSNKMKYERLGVSEQIINTYGAVSEPVVDAMARNAKRLAKADFGIAISGVAGPTGGSATKPVGMVCFALAYDKAKDDVATTLRTFTFPGDREMIRDRAAKMALTMLRFHLLGQPLPF